MITKESIECYGSIFWGAGAVVACCCGFKRAVVFHPAAYRLPPETFQNLVDKIAPFNPQEVIFEGEEPPQDMIQIIAGSPFGNRPRTIREDA